MASLAWLIVLLLDIGRLSFEGTVATGIHVCHQLVRYLSTWLLKFQRNQVEACKVWSRLRIRTMSLLPYSFGQRVTKPPQIQGLGKKTLGGRCCKSHFKMATRGWMCSHVYNLPHIPTLTMSSTAGREMVTKGDLSIAQGSSFAQKHMQLLLNLVFRSSVFRCWLNWVSMVGKETKEIFFFSLSASTLLSQFIYIKFS